MIKVEYVSAVSAKTGKPYYALDVQLTETYKKRVFLTPAEVELYNLSVKDKQN